MAQTGKLGAADSLLGNLLPAFAGADDALPSTDPRTGVLGTSDALLAQIILDLSGPDNPRVFNVWATSTLVFVQSAESGPSLKGHPSADWVLGGHDSWLGEDELGFTGPDDALPATGTRSGKLGLGLGSIVVGLAGAETAKVFHLSAQTTLTIVQSAASGAELKGHPSARWVLGGQDSYLGNAELAYVPVDPRPTTGTLTGKLGTVDSALANMRLALGELEGDSSAQTWIISAESALDLSVAAELTNFSRGVAASSILSALSSSAISRVAWSVNGATVITFGDSAGSSIARSVSAESTIPLVASADLFPWTIWEVDAVSSLELADAATGRHARFWPVAESTLELDQLAEQTQKNLVVVLASSLLELGTEADGRHAHFRPVSISTLELASSADGRHAHFRPAGTSTLELVSSGTSRHAHFRPTAISTLDLATSAFSRFGRFWPSAESTLDLTQDAHGIVAFTYSVGAESYLDLFDWAEGRHASFRPAGSSALTLVQTVGLTKTLGLEAESVLQTITEEYDPDLDEIITTITGLNDSATVARVGSYSVRTLIPITGRAGAYRIKADAKSASAENALDLSDQCWKNEVGSAWTHIPFSQTATIQRANPTTTAIELTDTAGVSVVRKRSVTSTLELKQSVAYSIYRREYLYEYHPFVGEGPSDAPTPPPATLTI